MKLIIIEGLDNTGKSTVIQNVKEYFEKQNLTVNIIHCDKPEEAPHDIQAKLQNQEYINLAHKLIEMHKNNEYDIIIIDRCWYSEYVYGQIYRERNVLDVAMNIASIENSLNFYLQNNCYLIFLNVDNINFVMEHEDGLSIAKNDPEKIKIEQKLFTEAFNLSTFDKTQIIVNNNMNFRCKYHICNDITNFISKN